MPEPEAAVAADVWHGVRELLDRELHELPRQLREAVVLCDLEGKTRKEAAREAGVAEGTISGRLTTARRILAARLSRRGLTRSVGPLATVLVQSAPTACVPAPLVASTVEAAAAVGAGSPIVAAASDNIAVWSKGVLKAMLLGKLKFVARS